MYIEMHAFPAVEQGAAYFSAAGDDVAAQVAVQRLAGVRGSTVAVYQNRGGQGDATASREGIRALGKGMTEPQVEMAVAAVSGADFVISTPGQGCQQAGTSGFLHGGAQGEDDAGCAFLRGLGAGGGAYGERIAAGDGLLLHVVFTAPASAECAEVVFRCTQGNGGGVCLQQGDAAAYAFVAEGGGEGDGVFPCCKFEEQLHLKLRVPWVCQGEGGAFRGAFLPQKVQIAALGAIRVSNVKGVFARMIAPLAAGIKISGEERPLCQRGCQGVIRSLQPGAEVADIQLSCLRNPECDLVGLGKEVQVLRKWGGLGLAVHMVAGAMNRGKILIVQIKRSLSTCMFGGLDWAFTP